MDKPRVCLVLMLVLPSDVCAYAGASYVTMTP